LGISPYILVYYQVIRLSDIFTFIGG